jgi:prepilin-type N-terminal cleavage/methylation domain-containing protein
VTRRGARGFTLIEIAVAIAILGIGVVTLQQIYQGGLRLQIRSSRQSRAVLHARATMDGLLFQRNIANHTEERTTREGFRTRILVRDATPEEGGLAKDDLGMEANDQTQSLHYVEVEVGWTDGTGVKTFTLHSLRIAREEEGG